MIMIIIITHRARTVLSPRPSEATTATKHRRPGSLIKQYLPAKFSPLRPRGLSRETPTGFFAGRGAKKL